MAAGVRGSEKDNTTELSPTCASVSSSETCGRCTETSSCGGRTSAACSKRWPSARRGPVSRPARCSHAITGPVEEVVLLWGPVVDDIVGAKPIDADEAAPVLAAPGVIPTNRLGRELRRRSAGRTLGAFARNPLAHEEGEGVIIECRIGLVQSSNGSGV